MIPEEEIIEFVGIKYRWISIIQSMFCNIDSNILYSDMHNDNSIVWYFEKVDSSVQPFMCLYDMYADDYEIVTNRWMGLNDTKNIEELEIYLVLCSSNLVKEKVKWYSSDETVAIVDETTGEVTSVGVGDTIITAYLENAQSISKSYTLHVESFEDGVYYIRNTVVGNYLASSSVNDGGSIVIADSTNNTNSKWRVKIQPNGLYGLYLLNENKSNLFLTLNEELELSIATFNTGNGTVYRDTAEWTILKDSNSICKICMPYLDVDIESYNYIYVLPDTSNVFFGQQINPFYDWELISVELGDFYEVVDFYYDNAFIKRCDGSSDSRPHYNTVLLGCMNVLSNEFMEEFNLELEINFIQYESFADKCKSLNRLTFDDMCPANPKVKQECSNMRTTKPDFYGLTNGSIDCTDDTVVAWEFRQYDENCDENPAALFCGHKLYDDDGNGKNRSYFNPGNNSAMILCIGSGVNGYINTVIHEFGHCFGANDHYHVSFENETKQSCGRGVKCSTCGLGAYRRAKNCVMNGGYTEDYNWCEDCRFDVEMTLMNRYGFTE